MSKNLNEVLESLVKVSPPGETDEIKKDLLTILEGISEVSIDKALETTIKEKGAVFSRNRVVSHLNKDSNSSKYIDYEKQKAFNIDISKQTVIDEEDFDTSSLDFPSYYDKLVSLLREYGNDHYPSSYGFSVIPQVNGDVNVILIGQRINQDNFFTGQWRSHYKLLGNQVHGKVSLDIHYYEDGNVRLHFDEETEVASINGQDASSIVNFINTTENDITYKVVENFNELNQKYFKNLRRLLPVTRSKINWGKAIGNYRLGSDVVNKS